MIFTYEAQLLKSKIMISIFFGQQIMFSIKDAQIQVHFCNSV